MRLDAHQHYWQISRGDYGWMTNNDAVADLRRDFLPSDLAALRESSGVSRTVVVQAAPSIEETEFLLALADREPSIACVVGWIDFEQPLHRHYLERFANHPKFAGVRPMIQDIADPLWMLGQRVQWAFEAVVELDLTFDALGLPKHLNAFDQLFSRYPLMRTVIDHAMKPDIRHREFEYWADGMKKLAEHPQVFCKCSGLLTEAKSGDGPSTLKPYIDFLLREFTSRRLMWGSDWPVLNLVSDYHAWLDVVLQLIPKGLDRDRLLGVTAREFYRID